MEANAAVTMITMLQSYRPFPWRFSSCVDGYLAEAFFYFFNLQAYIFTTGYDTSTEGPVVTNILL